MPANSDHSSPGSVGQSSHWSSHEKRFFAVEAALRSFAQSGTAAAQANLKHMIGELIDEYRRWQDGEVAAMKRAGAVALQCARVLDSMEKRLAALRTKSDLAPMSQQLASELENLRAVAHEHLSAALSRESARERSRFPIVFLN
jgi:hypothetical protein